LCKLRGFDNVYRRLNVVAGGGVAVCVWGFRVLGSDDNSGKSFMSKIESFIHFPAKYWLFYYFCCCYVHICLSTCCCGIVFSTFYTCVQGFFPFILYSSASVGDYFILEFTTTQLYYTYSIHTMLK
jgi:hypothetical protein